MNAHDVVGIGGIADGVARPQQHLEQDVRDAPAQLGEPLPGILLEESHRGVESCTAPHFEAEEARHPSRDKLRNRQHVVGADPRGQKGLMRVTHRRVGDEQPALVAHPFSKAFRPQRLQPLARAGGRRVERGDDGCGRRLELASGIEGRLDVGAAIHDHIADIGERLGGPVARGAEHEELRRVVDERGGGPPDLNRMADEFRRRRYWS